MPGRTEQVPIQAGLRVIGTAGHVDHGKSTLIEALTGTHPDRLKEEQARAMTIDLGFGWLRLPDGREIGIVDVPGHRDFVENMLSGIAAIDAVLLTVAADEGVMPQTIEHLAIIDLLQIPSGVIALTKTDLISDANRLAEAGASVREAVRDTVLQDATIVPVSSRTRQGLQELLTAIEEVLRARPARPDLGRPRLGLDRVFQMEGFGTVVTGTLTDGHLCVGDEVVVLPSGLKGRVRGLQNHHKQVDRVSPGTRTAVNLSGISAEQLRRGEVLIHPGDYQPTRRLDARVRMLASAPADLVHNREAKVFVGSSSCMATVRVLGAERLTPGEAGWIQLELREPLVCSRGDAFVLRRPSPPETVGGGMIIDPHPSGRHKRFDERVLSSLEAMASGNATQILREAVGAGGPATIPEIVGRSGLRTETAIATLQDLLHSGEAMDLGHGTSDADRDRYVVGRGRWSEISAAIDELVSGYHGRFPLRGGMPREELKSQLGLSAKVFNAVLRRKIALNQLVERGAVVARPGHEIRFSPSQHAAIDALIRRFDASPYVPPTMKECSEAVGDDVLAALRELNLLVAVSPEIVFRRADYDSMVANIRSALQSRHQLRLAEVRDMFQTSRKYAQALLEHLDAMGVTERTGDIRTLAT